MKYSHTNLFLIIAFVLFVLGAVVAGGIVSGNLPWLLPAGLASLTLALMVP